MSFRDSPHPLTFYGLLKWIDGRPLLDTIEPYRRDILSTVLYSFDGDRPRYNFALMGRGKKNWKSSDLVLATLYRFIAWHTPAGNDCFILANDEDQAGDDLSLMRKLIVANPDLLHEVDVQSKVIYRNDGKGKLEILPARDSAGAHGKTYSIAAFDEIHAYRNYDILEALAQDPTRHDSLTYITSYNGLYNKPGIPLFDFLKQGKEGQDPRMFFSWYSGDFSTDPTLAEASPEERANPSMASWGNDGYLEQQRRRLPAHRYRRLHLNMPGAPDGAVLDPDKVLGAIGTAQRIAPGDVRVSGSGRPRLFAYVDMSGGSSDDAVLGIAYYDAETKQAILASLMSQKGRAPFNPRDAVALFAKEIKAYGLSTVQGDAFGGQTFREDFKAEGIAYKVYSGSASDLYEEFEPKLNAGEILLLNNGKLQDQLMSLVYRGNKITHPNGGHDDFANAAVGALLLASGRHAPMVIDRNALASFVAASRSPSSTFGPLSGARRPRTLLDRPRGAF